MRALYCALALVGNCAFGCVQAMNIDRLHTEYADGEYRLEMVAVVAAPPERIAAVIRDYARYRDLDSRILEARVLERSGADRLLLFTRLDVCFVVFCREVQRVEDVQEFPNGLHALAVPDRSDVRHGETRTEFTPDAAGTRIHYTTSIAPKFWVPTWFGRRWMLQTLRDATVALFTNIETRAGSMQDGATRP